MFVHSTCLCLKQSFILHCHYKISLTALSGITLRIFQTYECAHLRKRGARLRQIGPIDLMLT